jgi:hypothetical protein
MNFFLADTPSHFCFGNRRQSAAALCSWVPRIAPAGIDRALSGCRSATHRGYPFASLTRT